jgi:hypothetical protein
VSASLAGAALADLLLTLPNGATVAFRIRRAVVLDLGPPRCPDRRGASRDFGGRGATAGYFQDLVQGLRHLFSAAGC